MTVDLQNHARVYAHHQQTKRVGPYSVASTGGFSSRSDLTQALFCLFLRLPPPAVGAEHRLHRPPPQQLPGVLEGVGHPRLTSGMQDHVDWIVVLVPFLSFTASTWNVPRDGAWNRDALAEDAPQRRLSRRETVWAISAHSYCSKTGLEAGAGRPKPVVQRDARARDEEETYGDDTDRRGHTRRRDRQRKEVLTYQLLGLG